MIKTKKERIIDLLKKNTNGLTILDIAKELNISRNSIPVTLMELECKGLINVRPIGRAKLHYWKGVKK